MTSSSQQYDAVIVGAGPNGLAAAVTLAQEGCRVIVFEASSSVGGGARSDQVTLPGFTHDICSAVYALGIGSPFFRELPLANYGLEWIQPEFPLAHPFDDGTAAVLKRSIEETGRTLGDDGARYEKFMAPLAKNWEKILADFLGPFRIPRHPLAAANFAPKALRSAQELAKSLFEGKKARGLLAGLGGHTILPLDTIGSAASILILGALGHAVGWPVVKGGAQNLSDALCQYLLSLGGEVATEKPISTLSELPPARTYFMNVTPRQLDQIAGDQLPAGYLRRLSKFRYGSGVFKVDWALDGPVPWKAAECRQAGTVHLGGTLEEIAAAEAAVGQGKHPEKPYVLVVQQSLFDDTRAPQGKHTCWAYCHVPHGSTEDMTSIIANQVERFAPGFQDLIIGQSTRNTVQLEAYNPNYIGGDIIGGVQDLRQQFTRPLPRLVPYSTPNKSIYICSSSTPPGGGVHGMCGYFAAKAALKRSLA